MDLNTILQTCFTKQQALRKLEELKEEWEKETFKYEIASSPSTNAQGPRNDTSSQAPRNDTSTTLSAGVIASEAKQSFNDFAKITEKIKTMESLVIFSAIPLPEEQIPVLGNFVRKTFPEIKLIDLKIDPNLIGGASLSWKGNLKNYSLRSKFSWK